MSKKNNKVTRQGVRDLNHLKSKPAGIRLEMPPSAAGFCKHSRKKEYSLSGDTICQECGKMWDYRGHEYEDIIS